MAMIKATTKHRLPEAGRSAPQFPLGQPKFNPLKALRFLNLL